MNGPNDSERQGSAAAEGQGVLGNLPRTRPQRRSPRRAASAATAQDAAVRNGPASPAAAPGARGSRRKPPAAAAPAAGQRRKRAARSAADGRAAARRKGGPRPEPVPKQGYETEPESARGPVQPPGGAELVASAFEIVGELAKSGVSTGERLLKDVFARLSPS